MQADFPKFDLFDFWFCIVLETAAAVGLVVALPWRHASHLARFGVGAVFYTLLTAGIVGWLSPKSGVDVFPLVESWWHGHFRPRKAATRVLGAAGVGVANSILTIVLSEMPWHTLPKHHFVPNVLEAVCSAIVEEILFRGVIFVALVGLVRWMLRLFSQGSEGTAFWTANLLQALIFGVAHRARGMGSLQGKPWYIRLPVSQNWGGLLLGWIFWQYGLESAIVCHATYDLSFYVL